MLPRGLGHQNDGDSLAERRERLSLPSLSLSFCLVISLILSPSLLLTFSLFDIPCSAFPRPFPSFSHSAPMFPHSRLTRSEFCSCPYSPLFSSLHPANFVSPSRRRSLSRGKVRFIFSLFLMSVGHVQSHLSTM